MDCVAPSLRYPNFKFNPTSPLSRFSIPIRKVKDWVHRRRTSALTLSCKTPLNPESNPSDPTILQSFRGFAVSKTQKLVSCLRAFVDDSERVSVSDLKSDDCLQCGSFGVAFLAITSSAKVHISPFIATLAANRTFVSGLLAWVIAQSAKMFLNFFVEKKWDFRILYASGGMPSSHSALCMALTTSVALCHGVADSLFPVCFWFSLIVMYDAIGVRRHAGMQAQVLNMIVEDLFQGHPISQKKLKELLGHTPSQVLAGAVLGSAVACVCCRGCLVAT